MITIQRLPWLRALPLLLVCSVVLGFATQGITGAIVDLDNRLLVGALGGVGWFLVLAGGISLAYRPFAFDPQTRQARVGGRTVPVESFTEAARSVSAASNGAAYLVYRFRSTEGVTVRVLVAGRPLPGLDAAGMQALSRFLELAPIPGPAADEDAARDSLASTILADGKKVPASAAALLAELGTADATTTTAGVVDADVVPAVDTATTPEMQADDLAAIEALAPTAGLGTARRIAGFALGLVLGGFILAAVGVLIAGAVGVDVDGPGAGLVVGIALGLFALTGLAWSILGDLHTRAVRAAGRRWLEAADAATRGRGLPTPFHPAWLTFAPGHRMLTILAFTAGVLGMGAVIGGPVAMSMGEIGIGVAVLLPGLALSGVAIWFWVAHRRRRRADVAWVIDAAGPRARF